MACGFFQNLRLAAFVVYFGQQPELIPAGLWVVGQVEKVTAEQGGLVALAFGKAVIMAMALQGASGQQVAALPVGEAAGVIVILEVREDRLILCAFQGYAGFLKVIVPPGGAGAAGFEAHIEAVDNRLVGSHAAVLSVLQGR